MFFPHHYKFVLFHMTESRLNVKFAYSIHHSKLKFARFCTLLYIIAIYVVYFRNMPGITLYIHGSFDILLNFSDQLTMHLRDVFVYICIQL